MNLQQLQYFISLAKIGHVTRASEILHISQPTLSMSITGLEEELGVSLFEKKGHSIWLTPYGSVFLEHICNAMDEIEIAKSEIEKLWLSLNKTIQISSTYSLSSSLLPGIIQSFKQKYPEITIHLIQSPNMDLIHDIAQGKTDFVFGRIIPDLSIYKNIKYIPLFHEDLVILINNNHPLAGKEELSLEELKGEDFIFFHKSTGFKSIVMEMFEYAGFKPNICYEVNDNATCNALVSANLGIAIVSPAPTYDRSTVRQVRIKSPIRESNIYMLWNSESEARGSDLYLKFLEHIKSIYLFSGESHLPL